MALDTLHYPNARICHHGSFDALPDPAHRDHEQLGGLESVKVEVNADELRIIDRPKDAITANAGGFPFRRVAIKRRLPSVKVADRMLDLDCVHVDS